jgi:hypothetical protein
MDDDGVWGAAHTISWEQSKGTAEQRRWIRRLHATLQAMPPGLCLSHTQADVSVLVYRQATPAELAAVRERGEEGRLFEGEYIEEQGFLVAQVPWPISYIDPTFGDEGEGGE